jgi:branched-chain amino acid transport system permease protein
MSAETHAVGGGQAAPRRWYLAGVLFFVLLPWLPVNGFMVHLAQTFAYTAIAVIGLNLLLGLSGQISLGQAGFYALGAYGSALTASKLGWPLVVSIPFGMLLAGAAGALVGVFALRTRGLYLAMTTLAVGFVIDILAQRWVGLTGGTMGLLGIPTLDFGDPVRAPAWFLYVTAVCLLMAQVASDYVADSAVGRKLRALRESEVFAASVGVQVAVWRAGTFAGAALLAGLGGALFAHQSGFVGSDAFNVRLSIALLIAAVVGGLGLRSGPLLGTAILMGIVELIAGIEKLGLIVYGSILLVVLLAFPQGAAGLFATIGSRLKPAAKARARGDSPAAEELTVLSGLEGARLAVDGVTKRYAGVTAVDRVSFEVAPGTVHGLIGPNGAGKSTLINVIAGLYRADEGRVLLGDADLAGLDTAGRTRSGLARTFQNLQLIEALTVLDNVMLGVAPTRSRWADFAAWWRGTDFELAERREAQAILSFLGLGDAAHRRPAELSYGHRKLVELARAIAQRPRLMLLDEPIAGLNAAEAQAIAAVVRRLRTLGVTIILVEHNMEFVMQLCDAVSVLDHGELIATGTPTEIQRDPRVISAYLGTEVAA